MKSSNPIPKLLLIASLTVLAGLYVRAQSNNAAVLMAETSSPGAAKAAKAKPPAAEPVTKTKPVISASAAGEVKSESKAAQAPPLASVPEAQSKEATPKNERLPFKLNDRNEMASEAPSASGLLLRTFGALLLIVGCIAAAGWALRYFGIIQFGKPQSEVAGLKVLDTVPLGERRTLTLVKFGERTLLIGATSQGLTLLAEQTDEAEPEGGYMPTVRTVTDLLDVNAAPPFEQELTRAALVNKPWSDRRGQ
jgi:flagellar biogenesis protein FliO